MDFELKPAVIPREEVVLDILKEAKVPITLEELTTETNEFIPKIGSLEVKESINFLRAQGYDIKEIVQDKKRLYVLVRFFDLKTEGMYRIHGQIELPIVMASDFHYGSENFFGMGIDVLKDDIKTFGIKSVAIAGDLIQGRMVFKNEAQELAIPHITDQMLGIADLLSSLGKDIQLHIIMGNHEEAVKAHIQIGLDPLKILAASLDNCSYYGHVALLEMKKDYTYMMMHGSGAVSTETSHMADKIWSSLLQKPNILHLGHSHMKDITQREWDKWSVMTGTLQRTSSWLLQKGYNAKLGWIILKEFSDKGLETLDRTLIPA